MKEIIINETNIELRLQNGLTARGEYYIKNEKVYIKAKSPWDLEELIKYKEEIRKEIMQYE